MTIESYLAELGARLPRIRRRRVLAEAREHLVDSAARHSAAGRSAHEAERAALEDFGDVDTVARRVRAEVAVHETRIASTLALAASALFVVPLYGVPENTLPPAPWMAKPVDIDVLQTIAASLWLTSLGFAAVVTASAWSRWPRLAAAALPSVSLGLVAAAVTSAALVVRWFGVAQVTFAWPLLAAPLALGCVGASAIAAAWAGRRRELLRD
jgi:hypothetical protein